MNPMKSISAIVLLAIIGLFGIFVGALVFQQPRQNSTPIPTQIPTTPTPIANDNLRISQPTIDEQVKIPVIVKGEARVFENVLQVRILDKDHKTLTQETVMSEGNEMGQFGPFEARLTFDAPEVTEGFIEVFHNSPRDGSEVDKITIPVKFSSTSPSAN
jgi:hypothetical protein